MEMELSMTMVVLVRGTKSSACPGSVEDEGMMDAYIIMPAWLAKLHNTCTYFRHIHINWSNTSPTFPGTASPQVRIREDDCPMSYNSNYLELL